MTFCDCQRVVHSLPCSIQGSLSEVRAVAKRHTMPLGMAWEGGPCCSPWSLDLNLFWSEGNREMRRCQKIGKNDPKMQHVQQKLKEDEKMIKDDHNSHNTTSSLSKSRLRCLPFRWLLCVWPSRKGPSAICRQRAICGKKYFRVRVFHRYPLIWSDEWQYF